MFDNIGLPEMLLILVIIMIFFGAGKLPDVATGLGKAIRNFKKAQQGAFDGEDEKKGGQTVADSVEKPETVMVAVSKETVSKGS
jgi:sec-independent protein translocase protein TatA